MEQIKKLPRLEFGEALELAANRLADFKGRSRRSEYFWWALSLILVLWFLFLVMDVWLRVAPLLEQVILTFLALAGNFAVCLRRLHDVGNSGWPLFVQVGIILLQLVLPVVGFDSDFVMAALGITNFVVGIYLFVLTLMDSEYENDYGPSPKYLE